MSKAKDQEKKIRKGFPGQHDGEVVQLVFHQHPLAMRKALIIGLLLVLVGVLIPFFQVTSMNQYEPTWKPMQFALIFVAAYWFYRWIGWYYTVYIVTDERLIEVKQRGFFNRKVSEYGLDKIQNINYHIRGFQAVLFQFGDITAQTYVGDIIMKMIHKPVTIHSKMLDIVRKAGGSTPLSD